MIPALVPLILEAALRALLAAVAVWIGLRLFRVGNVFVQKAAWGLVLVAALAMPLAPHWQPLPSFAALHLPAHLWDQMSSPEHASPHVVALAATPVSAQPSAPAPQNSKTVAKSYAETPQAAAEREISPAEDRYPAPIISNTDFSPSSHSASIPAPNPGNPVRIAVFAWLLYLGVFAALFLRLIVGLASALKLWMTAEPVSGLVESDTSTSLRSSLHVVSPVNIGSGIVLPADYATWDQEKLRIVLAHERSHVRQGDFYLQILATLYSSFFWFSPLGWWLKHKLTELSEAISDRAGLEEAASRSSYAQLLLEFAALPRPTLTGVAMARTSHLSQRIERLLNESTFRQAFAAGRSRALVAVLLVPAALFAATTMVRVEAAAAPTPAVQAAQAPLDAQSTPEQVTQPVPAPAPEASPVPPPPSPEPSPSAKPTPPAMGAPNPVPAPVAPLPPNPAFGTLPSLPPMPQISIRIPPDSIRIHIDPAIEAEIATAREGMKQYRDFAFTGQGEPYALVGDPGTKTRFNGIWDGDCSSEIEKARKIAHGHFLWFRHEGKSYIVDDPAVVAQVEAMNKPMDDLRTQMRTLGDQMRDIGKEQREMGKQMRDITVPTPDISKQIAEMNATIASFQAKQGTTISQKDLGEMQRQLGHIQAEIGALQGKIGAQQATLGSGMGKFGERQGKLGSEMGKLGEQMGQLARENQSKIKTIIDQSLSNGKAHPVE